MITYIVDSFVSNFRYSERFREKLLQEEAEIVEEEVKEKKNICLSKTYFCFNAASLGAYVRMFHELAGSLLLPSSHRSLNFVACLF